MSFAFEVTAEDVWNVVTDRFGKACDYERAEALFEELDTGAIEKAALYGNDLDTQTDYAYDEIEKQLKEKGLVTKDSKLTSRAPSSKITKIDLPKPVD